MNKMILIIVSITVVLSVIFYVVLQSLSGQKQPSVLSGEHVFYNTEKINELQVGGVQLFKKNGVWLNSDGYYLNNAIADNFLFALKESVYKLPVNEIANGTNIKLLQNGEELASFDYFEDESGSYVSPGYEISQHFDLPKRPQDWFVQPLLPLDNSEIETVSGGDGRFSFNDLIFYHAVKKETVELGTPQSIQVILQNGLVVDLSIFDLGEKIWVEIKLSLTVLPTKTATDFIKYNAPLYEGWIFEISPNLHRSHNISVTDTGDRTW